MNSSLRLPLLAASLAGLFAASPAFAATSLDRPAALSAPVPVTIVHPTDLPSRYENARIRVAFTLDSSGTPHHVTAVGSMPSDLAARVLPAVAQWRFTPCVDANGKPVARHVVLPLLLQ